MKKIVEVRGTGRPAAFSGCHRKLSLRSCRACREAAAVISQGRERGDTMKKMMKAAAYALLAGALAVTCAVPASAAGTPAVSVSTQAKKSGFVKTGKTWSYYKKGKKVTGLKKIGGRYYFFNKKGRMVKGKKNIGGFVYYFAAKKDGKAPAVVNTKRKVGKKYYYFTKTGRGFLASSNKKANLAAASVMNGVKFTNDMTSMEKLETTYRYILKKYDYEIADVPNLNSRKWIGTCAYNMVKDGDAKCYNYAALTGVCAKALGFKVTVVTGTSKRSATSVRAQEHAWVEINGRVLDTCFDDTNQKDGEQYFYRTFEEIRSGEGTEYYPEKRFNW